MTGVAHSSAGARLSFEGDRVVKEHAAGTDPAALAVRLRLAASHPAFVPPLEPAVGVAPSGRPVTVWPRVTAASPSDPGLPWAEFGTLLAGLHRTPPPAGLPAHGWRGRLDRARDRAPAELASLGDALAEALDRRGEPGVLLHGDWHLGQLGRWDGTWRLLDVDDTGVGDPAWDLARPAGFWASGLLDDGDWQAFLAGYRTAGGPAVPASGDPWPGLDLPARVAVFVAAVRYPLTAPDPHSDDTAEALLAACLRMAQ